MVPYPVMFDLQGRRGSGGQQGLAGTPGAAVRIEKIKINGTQLTYSTKSIVLTVLLNGALNY